MEKIACPYWLSSYDRALLMAVAGVCHEAAYDGLVMPRYGVELISHFLDGDKKKVAYFIDYGVAIDEEDGFFWLRSEAEENPEELLCSLAHYVKSDSYYDSPEDNGSWNDIVIGIMKTFIRRAREEKENYCRPEYAPELFAVKAAGKIILTNGRKKTGK